MVASERPIYSFLMAVTRSYRPIKKRKKRIGISNEKLTESDEPIGLQRDQG